MNPFKKLTDWFRVKRLWWRMRRLEKVLKAGGYNAPPAEKVKAAALRIESLSEQFKPLLTPEAWEALNQVSHKSLIGQYDETRPEGTYRCFSYTGFFAAQVTEETQPRAMEEIARALNELAKEGKIHGHLAMPSRVELAGPGAIVDLRPPKPVSGPVVKEYAVFCFPHLKGINYPEVLARFSKVTCVEGEVGKKFE